MHITLTGFGWVNASGAGHGRKDPFSTDGDGNPPKLSKKEIFHRPFPRFGRMDSYSRFGVAAIAMALKDAGLEEWTDTREIALIGATVSGSLCVDADYYDTVIPEGGHLASPNLFAFALPNIYLGEAAIHFGLTGPSFVLCESLPSGLEGLNLAVDGLARGDYHTALAGFCDTGIPPFLAGAGTTFPEALFFVLEGERRAGCFSYGTLTREGSGGLRFEGANVESLDGLALMCAARAQITGEYGGGA